VVQHRLDANLETEKASDCRGLADFYADDTTYGWNIGPKEDVMCVGIDEIRGIALGSEMEGLEGWRYPYQRVVTDDRAGEVVGFWKQMVADADSTSHQAYGIGAGGSRDFFDFGHTAAVYVDLIKAGKLSEGMKKRIKRQTGGEQVPGWFPLGKTPVPRW
jgi:hypothetical protein